ncbi:hypothetical protein QAD02_014743 [Eretmocerus hayati]|uniref:Uncharacterized protein n=1 Tax=Eretmocerus hayati TaxID=131215 RepID=A0ACC2P7W2_9HYME|nr:hypothetical protein QAD02_014743 [Eretmocerus hayati]
MFVQTFIGPMIHSSRDGALIVHENACVVIKNGKIDKVDLDPDLKNPDIKNVKFLKKGQFLIPGFIDGHIHAPQLPNLGLGYDKKLFEWLEHYTYPHEMKYTDLDFAEKVFDSVVRRTLKMGTTTACYFASLFIEASLVLAQKVVEHGQRALVGKVNMNLCRFVEYYETFEESLRNTESFIENIRNIGSPLIEPVITPRSALSINAELGQILGELAKRKNVHIQTHIGESLSENKAVRDVHSGCSSFTEVYETTGLLTNKTVLAHGIHLSDEELATICKHGSSIIHCPSSNTCLRSGLCDVRKLKAAKVKIGLGTDISGGNSPSILEVMRAALDVSVHISFSKSSYEPLTYKDVFHLATLGGAEALAMDDRIGNFEPGKEFDALVIDLSAPGSVLDDVQDYTLLEKLQRFIYSGDDRNIVEVYVAGRRVV